MSWRAPVSLFGPSLGERCAAVSPPRQWKRPCSGLCAMSASGAKGSIDWRLLLMRTHAHQAKPHPQAQTQSLARAGLERVGGPEEDSALVWTQGDARRYR